MEEKKLVEKTGLPIVINGVKLTEKDLLCLARHIRELVMMNWNQEANDAESCGGCPLISQCANDNRIVDQWGTFDKLAKLTGVNIPKMFQTKSPIV